MSLLLNHFYVTVDAATFAAVEESALVRELGALEKRTMVRKDRAYTGLYLYGENTYLELLHPDSTLGAPSGIAWTGESEGALIYRGEAPWFRMHTPEPPLSSMTEWVMQYAPEFSPSGSRADAISIYVRRCGKERDRELGLFADVSGLTISLPPREAEILRGRRAAQVELTISTAQGKTGITAARLRLRRDAASVSHRLGSTSLSLEGRTALFRF